MSTDLAAPYKFRYQLYQALHQKMPTILSEAVQAADEIGLAPAMRGKLGLTG